MAESTKDYKKFKMLPGNRAINKGHVREIAKSIALYPDLLPSRPILVNERFEIIDGQHRFTACQQLDMPVFYTVEKGLNAESALALNINQRNWNLEDYAKSFADAGIQAYKDFLEVKEEYPNLPAHIISAYLQGGRFFERTKMFRSGKFAIPDLQASRKYLDWLEDLISIDKSFKKGTAAIPALIVFKHEEYDHTRMLQKMTMYGDTAFSPYGTHRDIIRSLEDVYNFRQHKDIVRF